MPRCVHRIGDLAIGELAVWVGVSAAHRDAAFAACRFIIDEVKSRVPIWKHEHYVEGDAAGCIRTRLRHRHRNRPVEVGARRAEKAGPEWVATPPADLGTRISQYRCCLPALAEFST